LSFLCDFYAVLRITSPPNASINALQCFEAAARHLSFTLAAQELHLTQSAVSKQSLN